MGALCLLLMLMLCYAMCAWYAVESVAIAIAVIAAAAVVVVVVHGAAAAALPFVPSGLWIIPYRVHCSLSLFFSCPLLLGWCAAAYDAHTSLRPLLTLVTCECLNAKHAYFLFLSHIRIVCVFNFANSKKITEHHRSSSSSNIIRTRNKIN